MYDEALAERVRPLLSGRGQVAERRMFGGLAFLVAGNMAVAVSAHGGLMVRVPPGRTSELLGEPGTRPMEMHGRETQGWIRVDAATVEDDDELAHWVAIGVEHASRLRAK